MGAASENFNARITVMEVKTLCHRETIVAQKETFAIILQLFIQEIENKHAIVVIA
jgi:hypothetical protein